MKVLVTADKLDLTGYWKRERERLYSPSGHLLAFQHGCSVPDELCLCYICLLDIINNYSCSGIAVKDIPELTPEKFEAHILKRAETMLGTRHDPHTQIDVWRTLNEIPRIAALFPNGTLLMRKGACLRPRRRLENERL